jgi:GTP:adenosylcobinamide-phosphate guanylyltransferase
MAKAYGVPNKCLMAVGGKPMVSRVAEAVMAAGIKGPVRIAIEDFKLLEAVNLRDKAISAARSAPGSALSAIRSGALTFPVLITTGDHALLTPEMVQHFCKVAEQSSADICAGLARAETIQAAYPETRRTYFTLGPDRVSGCNLFAVLNPAGLKLLERWQYLEHVRKKPWRLVAAFGFLPLILFLFGQMTLDKAFARISQRLGLVAKPVIMPFAEAAIDVDKPADKELAEAILAARMSPS